MKHSLWYHVVGAHVGAHLNQNEKLSVSIQGSLETRTAVSQPFCKLSAQQCPVGAVVKHDLMAQLDQNFASYTFPSAMGRDTFASVTN